MPPDRCQFHQSLALSAFREVNLALLGCFWFVFVCFGVWVFGFVWCLVSAFSWWPVHFSFFY